MHPAGDRAAGNVGRRHVEVLTATTPPNHRLDPQHIRGRHVDHDLAGTRNRVRRLARHQHLGGTEPRHHGDLHVCTLLASNRSMQEVSNMNRT